MGVGGTRVRVIAARRAVPAARRLRSEAAASRKEQAMHTLGEPWITRHTRYFSDPDADPEALLNDATEWLHYAHSAVLLLAELVHDRSIVDARRLPTMLEGIAAFIDMGMSCATQAHGRMQWQRVQPETIEDLHSA